VVASLGYTRAQDLVGRYDLLEQVAMEDKIDLTPLIAPLEEYLDLQPLDLPVAEEAVDTRAEAGLVVARPIGWRRRRPRRRSPGWHRKSAAAPRCAASSRALPTPTIACSEPSSLARSPGRGSSKTAPRRAMRSSPASSSTAARSRARARRVQLLRGGPAGRGGAQDGVGKAMLGGTIAILKARGAAASA